MRSIMSKSKIAIIFFIISLAAFLFYYLALQPSDIEEKGEATITALVTLFTAIVSLLTSLVSLFLKLIEVKKSSMKG